MTGELRALEFFAGIGLARMGLERAGFRVVFANDIDPKKLQMHEGHWGQTPRITSAMFLNWKRAPCRTRSWRGLRSPAST